MFDTRIVKVTHIGESVSNTTVAWWCGTCERKFNSSESSVMFVRKVDVGKKVAVQLVLQCESCKTNYLFEGSETKTGKAKLKFKNVIYLSRRQRASQVIDVPREVEEYWVEQKEKAEQRAADKNYRKIRL